MSESQTDQRTRLAIELRHAMLRAARGLINRLGGDLTQDEREDALMQASAFILGACIGAGFGQAAEALRRGATARITGGII